MSAAEFDRLVELGFYEGQHVELLDGHVVDVADMGPQGFPHRVLTMRLTTWLARRVPEPYWVQGHTTFPLSDRSRPEPDVVVMPPTRRFDEALLMVEVAESSLKNDRDIKARLYAQAGVPTYWLVDRPHGLAYVMTQPANGRYRRIEEVREGGVLTCADLPGLSVSIVELFALEEQ